MRDYYYILGIRRKADLKEIQTAYQKLSLKFHPSENRNDIFYADYYRRIKEAYNELSDEQRRYRYDKMLRKFEGIATKKTVLPPPVIASFFASKKASHIDDLITISWEVLNADTVHITPIGQVASNGTQTIRLQKKLATQHFINISLEASNSDKANTTSKILQLKNLSYSDWEEEEIISPIKKPPLKKKAKKKKASTPTKKQTRNSHQNSRKNKIIAYLIVIALMFIMAVMLYIIYSLNPMF